TVTLSVTDGTYSARQTATWTVLALALDSVGDQTGFAGDSVSWQLAPAAPASASLTFTAANLPAGTSLDSSTGLIAGTLANSADANGPYLVTAWATAGGQRAERSFAWDVAPRVVLLAPGDLSNVGGDTVSVAPVAVDADASATLTWSASGLPAGVSVVA